MSHVYIAAAHKSSGKTTLSIALCAGLRARGLAVQPFKKGPDYIDPLWLGCAAGRSCENLDYHTMSRDEILSLFAQRMASADIGVIEGNKGLYDGLALDGSNSNAALAADLGAPVILVLDTQGITRGVAPLLLGYQSFGKDIRIAGVILNKVGGGRHESKLRAAVEYYTDIPVIGAVQRTAELHIEERHLGLVPSNELGGSDALVGRMAACIADQVDLDAVSAVAATAPAPPPPPAAVPRVAPTVRIGYALDAAFGFYYASDLDALRDAGAELIPFSPLRDATLPDCDGLFIGGGFPETHMDALEANTDMRRAVRSFVDNDRPVYAECGGLMYLCDRLTWNGRTRRMAGVIPAEVVMRERPEGRGYVRLRETAAHPWGRAAGTHAPGHEFHYSGLVNVPDGLGFAYAVERGHGLDGRHDGLVYRRLLAAYAHMRHTRENPWADRFVAYVRQHRLPA
jgi:cobyrinic acid a,c-diamide synthase